MEDFEFKYVVLFSCKDEAGVVQDHPLRPFELEIEAKTYLDGYVDAIINHTEEQNPDKVRGLFRISKIGEENEQKEIPSKIKKKNSVNETT